MKNIEIAKILEWHNSGTLKTYEAVERICSLFSVVKSVVCDHPENDRTWMRSGKSSFCNKCGEMVKAN